MILLPVTRALYVAVDPVDLRRGFDSLCELAREQLGLDALRSALVLFVSRDRAKAKILFHDGSGYVILYKRLDRGRFLVPGAVLAGDRSVKLDPRELALLLGGLSPR